MNPYGVVYVPPSGFVWQAGGAGSVTLTTAGAVDIAAAGSSQSITLTPSGTGSVNIASPSGYLRINNSPFATNNSTNNFLLCKSNGLIIRDSGDSASLAVFTNSGHLLLGGLTTDGTGVAQFPVHTTSAGGVTMGAMNIFTPAAGNLRFLAAGGTTLQLSSASFSTQVGQMGADAAHLYVQADTGGSVVIRTNGATVATTWDSSQNEITSGNLAIALGKSLTLGNAYAAGVVVPTGTIIIKDSTGTAYRVGCAL